MINLLKFVLHFANSKLLTKQKIDISDYRVKTFKNRPKSKSGPSLPKDRRAS